MASSPPLVTILTPVKDAASLAAGYFERLGRLSYPAASLSLALLESDSRDGTFGAFRRELDAHRARFRQAALYQKDFGYFIPEGLPRWAPEIQLQRRAVLARSRNHLLFRGLGDADWALWLDADVIGFPADLIERLIAFDRDIVHPHCVKVPGGPSFDTNAWTDHGARHMDAMRGGPPLARLHTVGGTVLLVRADRHRDGLVFPPFPYGNAHPHARPRASHQPPRDPGEIETEGLGLMADDMGLACWGVPELEVIHRDQ